MKNWAVPALTIASIWVCIHWRDFIISGVPLSWNTLVQGLRESLSGVASAISGLFLMVSGLIGMLFSLLPIFAVLFILLIIFTIITQKLFPGSWRAAEVVTYHSASLNGVKFADRDEVGNPYLDETIIDTEFKP